MLKKQRLGHAKGHRSQPQRAPNSQSWNNLSNKINSAVLHCNPKIKVNIHKLYREKRCPHYRRIPNGLFRYLPLQERGLHFPQLLSVG